MILGLVHTKPEVFEHTAFFLLLDPQSTLIRHENEALQNVLQTGGICKQRFAF